MSQWEDYTDQELVRMSTAVEAILSYFEVGKLVDAGIQGSFVSIQSTQQYMDFHNMVQRPYYGDLEPFFRGIAKSLHQELKKRREDYGETE